MWPPPLPPPRTPSRAVGNQIRILSASRGIFNLIPQWRPIPAGSQVDEDGCFPDPSAGALGFATIQPASLVGRARDRFLSFVYKLL